MITPHLRNRLRPLSPSRGHPLAPPFGEAPRSQKRPEAQRRSTLSVSPFAFGTSLSGASWSHGPATGPRRPRDRGDHIPDSTTLPRLTADAQLPANGVLRNEEFSTPINRRGRSFSSCCPAVHSRLILAREHRLRATASAVAGELMRPAAERHFAWLVSDRQRAFSMSGRERVTSPDHVRTGRSRRERLVHRSQSVSRRCAPSASGSAGRDRSDYLVSQGAAWSENEVLELLRSRLRSSFQLG
jgi:hypothetical protein